MNVNGIAANRVRRMVREQIAHLQSTLVELNNDLVKGDCAKLPSVFKTLTGKAPEGKAVSAGQAVEIVQAILSEIDEVQAMLARPESFEEAGQRLSLAKRIINDCYILDPEFKEYVGKIEEFANQFSAQPRKMEHKDMISTLYDFFEKGIPADVVIAGLNEMAHDRFFKPGQIETAVFTYWQSLTRNVKLLWRRAGSPNFRQINTKKQAFQSAELLKKSIYQYAEDFMKISDIHERLNSWCAEKFVEITNRLNRTKAEKLMDSLLTGNSDIQNYLRNHGVDESLFPKFRIQEEME